MTICRWTRLRMRNVPNKRCKQNENTHRIFIKLFSSANYAVYKITWNNTLEADRPYMIIYSQYGAEKMRFVCRIIKGRIQTQKHTIGHLSSMATMITRKHLSVTFISTLPVLFNCLPSEPWTVTFVLYQLIFSCLFRNWKAIKWIIYHTFCIFVNAVAYPKVGTISVRSL